MCILHYLLIPQVLRYIIKWSKNYERLNCFYYLPYRFHFVTNTETHIHTVYTNILHSYIHT